MRFIFSEFNAPRRHEALKTRAVVRELAQAVEHEINNLLPWVSLRIIVAFETKQHSLCPFCKVKEKNKGYIKQELDSQ